MDATQPNSKAAKQLQTLQAVAEKETIIAILMALVAMLGMVTAYRTATAEEEVLLKRKQTDTVAISGAYQKGRGAGALC